MNFELSKEQSMIAESVAKFVADVSPVERFRRLRDADRGWEAEVWKQMGDYGWLGIAFAEDNGGIGGSFVDIALILERFGRGLVPEPYIASVVLAGGLLERRGSDEQIAAALTPMIDGDLSLALAYAERQSRYDLAECRTEARPSDGGFRLDGEKVWVLDGDTADRLLVVGRSEGDPGDRDGLSLFLVDAGADGVTRTAVRGMDGRRYATVRLESVVVGSEALLGDAGDAYDDLVWAVDRGAAAACAEGQGAIQELFERTVEYLKEREQFGRKIGTFQALQHRAAEMFVETELCRGTMWLAAMKADAEEPAERMRDVSAAKLQLSEGGWFVQKYAVQLHGGIAITDEQDIGLYFKRLRVLQGLFGDADHHVGRFRRLNGG